MLTSDFKHPPLLRGDPYEPGERWLVMDACSASCKCLGECIYTPLLFIQGIWCNQWSRLEMCLSMLPSGTADIQVNHEAVLCQEELFNPELSLFLFCVLSAAHSSS